MDPEKYVCQDHRAQEKPVASRRRYPIVSINSSPFLYQRPPHSFSTQHISFKATNSPTLAIRRNPRSLRYPTTPSWKKMSSNKSTSSPKGVRPSRSTSQSQSPQTQNHSQTPASDNTTPSVMPTPTNLLAYPTELRAEIYAQLIKDSEASRASTAFNNIPTESASNEGGPSGS